MAAEIEGDRRPYRPRPVSHHRGRDHRERLKYSDSISSMEYNSRESSPSHYLSSSAHNRATSRHKQHGDHHPRRRNKTTAHTENTHARYSTGTSSSKRQSHHLPKDRPGRSSREKRSTSARREHAPLGSRSSCRSSHADDSGDGDDEVITEIKPWFKKKTLWTGVATVATVLALVPASVSAKGSREAAAASMAAARASKKSATASSRSANAVEKSANAAVGSSMAQGHIDERGYYTGSRDHFGKGKASPLRRGAVA